MIYLITFSDVNYIQSAIKLRDSALQNGVDTFVLYTRMWLRSKFIFYLNKRKIFTAKRGAGYFAWKPFIILDMLKKITENDILIYSDAGIKITHDLKPLVNKCIKEEIMIFSNEPFFNREWTKRECFLVMNCDNGYYHDSPQVMGGFLIIRKTEFTIKFINEWLSFCLIEDAVTDEYDPHQKLSEFKEHRHDQSILSLLVAKYKIEIFRDPSQYGDKSKPKVLNDLERDNILEKPAGSDQSFTNSRYETIINCHREKNGHELRNYYYYFREQLKQMLAA